MKKTFIISVLLVLSGALLPAQSPVLQKADEYLAAMDLLPIPQAQAEVDFMLSSIQDSTTLSSVASKAYRHFRESKVMGAENVAVYIYDNWFASFKAVFDDIDELDEAEFHSFINRQSLIGAKAVPLDFSDEKGRTVTLPSRKRMSVIYFYTTECPKCLYTSIGMRDLLNGGKYRLDVYAVYVGEDLAAWHKYVSKELKIKNNCRTKVHHLLGGDTDYAVPYGVVQTPRLFLTDKSGTIIGRHLDPQALETLLNRKQPF